MITQANMLAYDQIRDQEEMKEKSSFYEILFKALTIPRF